MCASELMAHNLGREIQMLATPRHTYSHAKRPAAWVFQTLATLRHRFIQRAGRLTEPQGEVTLTLSPNPMVEQDLLKFLGLRHWPLGSAYSLLLLTMILALIYVYMRAGGAKDAFGERQ